MDKGPVNDQMPPLPGIFDLGLDELASPQDVVSFEYVRIENNTSLQTDATSYECTTTDQTAMYVGSSAHVAVRGRLMKTNAAGNKVPLVAADQAVLASNGYAPFIDARLRMNDVEVAMIQFPGHVSHLRNLLESGRDYLETVGPNAHYYLDEVSDKHDPNTINFTGRPAVISGAGGAATAPTAANFDENYVPVSLRDETQVLLAPLAAAIGAGADAIKNLVIDSRKNPNYDSAFAEKSRRAQASSGRDVNGDQQTPEPYELLLPLRDIFPILDREKVLRGTAIQIVFNKNNNAAASVWGTTATNEKISFEIDRFSMWIARVVPSTAAYSRLEAQLVSKPVATYQFENLKMYQTSFSAGVGTGSHVWQIGNQQSRPTKCVIAFQYADRLSNQKLNPLQFDLLNEVIESIQMECNNKRIPYSTYLPKTEWVRIVQELHRVGYKEADIADSACVNYKNWQSVYPICVFSLQNIEGQPYEVRNKAELRLEFNARTADEGVNTAPFNIFALVYSESTAYFDTSSGRTTLRIQ
jgi:hypothetical protein